MNRSAWLRTLFIVAAAVPACNGDGPDVVPDGSSRLLTADAATDVRPTFAPTFSAVYSEVFATHSCLLGLCHGEGAAGGGLNLFPRDGAHDRLLAASDSPECGHLGLAVVEPGEPASSLLVIKLVADPPCGVPMPPDELVDPRHVDQISEWISRGAPDD